jgi:hypothetical protein
MVLRHSSKIPVVAQVCAGRGCGVRTCLSLKTRKHSKLFGLIKGKVAAGIHILSSTWSTNRGLELVLRVADASEDPRIRPEFLDKAG